MKSTSFRAFIAEKGELPNKDKDQSKGDDKKLKQLIADLKRLNSKGNKHVQDAIKALSTSLKESVNITESILEAERLIKILS